MLQSLRDFFGFIGAAILLRFLDALNRAEKRASFSLLPEACSKESRKGILGF